jgi:hypothetical protein
MGARQSISQYSPLVLFFALFLMPIDWFSGTGFLFREAGAKPMNLFAAGWLLLLFIMGRNMWAMRVNIKAPYQLFIAGIVVSGGFAFLVGTINTPPLLTSDRSRSAQFFSQTAMRSSKPNLFVPVRESPFKSPYFLALGCQLALVFLPG